MKKLIFLVAFLISTSFGFAQKVEKGSSTKAETLYNSGDLAAAKTEIDNAIEYEIFKLKSKDKPVEVKAKSWYVKGIIYAAIASSDDAAVKGLTENPIEIAVEALNKTMELEKEGTVYYTFAQQKKTDLYGSLFNKAVEYYNNEDMEGALLSFEKVSLVEPKDTSALQNAVSIAYQLKKQDKVIAMAQKLIDLDFKKPYLYRMITQFDIDQGRELDQNHKESKSPEANPYYEKALTVLKKGLEANPDDSDLASTVITLYMRLDKTQDAIASIDQSLEANPDNRSLYLQKGLLLDKLGKIDEALASYKKATEIDPEYFDAFYSIGAIYYNRGVELNKEVNNLEYDKYGRPKDKKKFDELTEQMKEQFKLSMPGFEKSHQLNSADQEVIGILARIYNVLEMKDKYEAMSKKMSGN